MWKLATWLCIQPQDKKRRTNYWHSTRMGLWACWGIKPHTPTTSTSGS